MTHVYLVAALVLSQEHTGVFSEKITAECKLKTAVFVDADEALAAAGIMKTQAKKEFPNASVDVSVTKEEIQ